MKPVSLLCILWLKPMFSSRNIHFAILGIILGATSGYVFAFYQVQSSMPRPTVSASSGMPQGHPDVSNEQMLALFKQALEKNPNDPQLMTRYANFLFDLERYPEAVDWYQKVLALQPQNIDVQTDMGTALWNLGQRDKAMAAYQSSLAADPKHILTLHNLFVVQVEGNRDYKAAAEILKKMEEIDPKYPPLAQLKKKLEEAK